MNKELVVDTLKKNAVSVTCGVVAVAAVVAAFYPIGGMNDDLKTQATERAGKYDSLNAMLVKSRTLPVLDPGSGGTPPAAEPLKMFPNAALVEQGTAQVAALTGQTTQALNDLLAQTGGKPHVPLIRDALPLASSDSPKIEYREVYKLVLSTDPYVSGSADAAQLSHPVQPDPSDPNPVTTNDRLVRAHAVNLANDVLQSCQPPSAKLIADRTQWVKEHVYQTKVVALNGEATNEPEILRQFNDRAAKITDEMYVEQATLRKVYLDPDAFAVNTAIAGSTAAGGAAATPAVTDIWYSQVALWVQQDVAAAVAAANNASANVLTSPVKRVVRLQLNSESATMYLCPAPRANAGEGTGMPTGAGGVSPGVETETSKIPASFDKSPTGRTSNGMYDVIPFSLVLDVDASRVNQVIETLCANRLIAVTNEDVRSVDSATFASAGYLYGSASVVRLTLSGEELFLRKATLDLMPVEVKQQLGLSTAATGPGGPAAGQQPPRVGGGTIHAGS